MMAAMCKEFYVAAVPHEHGGYLCGNGQPRWREQTQMGEPGQWKKTSHCEVVKKKKKWGKHTFLPFGVPVAWIGGRTQIQHLCRE